MPVAVTRSACRRGPCLSRIPLARSNSPPWLPHAAMTRSAEATARSIHSSLWGPIGSAAIRSAFGDDDRKAKRLAIHIALAPHERANAMQRRIVGSSVTASAVEGFRPMNRTAGPSRATLRDKKYLYRSSGESTAVGHRSLGSPAVEGVTF